MYNQKITDNLKNVNKIIKISDNQTNQLQDYFLKNCTKINYK